MSGAGDLRIVYIVSSPHGGSTLVSHILGKHGNAVNLGEVSFLPKLLALDEPCSCGQAMSGCEFWDAVLAEHARKTGIDLRSDPYGIPLGDAPKDKHGSGKIDTQHQSKLRFYGMKAKGAMDSLSVLYAPTALPLHSVSLPTFTRAARNTIALYETAASVAGKGIVIDASKMPRKAAHLYRASPDRVRVLHLTRDSRGVVSSRKRYMPVQIAAKRWAHYHFVAENTLERWIPEGHRLRMAYEDFVGSPEDSLKRLFAWLDADYDPDCLVFDEATISHSAGGNPARFEMSGGIRPADERWRKNLTDADLEVIEKIAGPRNRAFGYG